MNLNEINEINGSVLALIGVLVTVGINYMIQLNRKSADITLADKKILSDDQRTFKESILSELNTCRSRVSKLQEENHGLQEKLLAEKQDKLSLTQEIIDLRYKIVQLKNTIEDIMKRVEDKELNDQKAEAGIESKNTNQ